MSEISGVFQSIAAATTDSSTPSAAYLFGGSSSSATLMRSYMPSGTNGIKLRMYQEMQNKIALQTAPFDTRLAEVSSKQEKVIADSLGIATARTAVDKALEAIESIDQALLDMRSALASIDWAEKHGDAEDKALYTQRYDSALARYNKAVGSYASDNNIIGRSSNYETWAANVVEYKGSSSSVGSSRLYGTYLGSDFRIEMKDGSVWVPSFLDLTSMKGLSMQEMISASTGSLVSYGDYNYVDPSKSGDKGDSIAFGDITGFSTVEDEYGKVTVTITYEEYGEEKTITGTLKQPSVKVGPAWMYNGLETAEDRESAREALSRATGTVFLTKVQMQAYDRTVTAQEEAFKAELEDLSNQQTKLLQQKTLVETEIQQDYLRRYSVIESQLDLAEVQKEAFQTMFASVLSDNNPFFA